MDYAGVLKALREGERLSQEELARLSGVSSASIGLQERGLNKPMPETIKLLAKGLATDTQKRVSQDKERDFLVQLWNAAGYPDLGVTNLKRSPDWDELLADAPEERAELALLLIDNPDSEDAKFVREYLRISRQRRLERERRG